MTEKNIQQSICIALSKLPRCYVFRANVGRFTTSDGRIVHIGLKGHSDLYGHIGGRAFFIECKALRGKPTPEQLIFIEQMRAAGAIAGICRSASDALKLIEGD